jgi:hypothetical protein
MFINLPSAAPRELPPAGNHALFLEKLTIFGTFKSDRDGWMDSVRAYFEFQYVRERRDVDGKTYPIRIGRTIYGSRNVAKFLAELILDFPKAKDDKGRIKAAAVVGRVYNCIITHDPAKRNPAQTVANLARISASVNRDIFEKQGFTMLGPAVFFSMFQNYQTNKPYETAAQLVACETFNTLAPWMQEKVGQTIEFCKFHDAENYNLFRNEDGAINLEPLNVVPAQLSAPTPPTATNNDIALDDEELPF